MPLCTLRAPGASWPALRRGAEARARHAYDRPVSGPEVTTSGRAVVRVYLGLLLGSTLAASLIWGINTIFLLDAGLTNFEAFSANAFFTLGMVLFEVPTGVVADTVGRRWSYLLGTVTLSVATLLYVLLWWRHAPFWTWAVSSVLLGLGFTFFSGAVDAWLVDALVATGRGGDLQRVFGRAQVVTGVATLIGSAGGGLLARVTNLGAPFVARAAILLVMFAVAYRLMHDVGFVPRPVGRPLAEARRVLQESLDAGWRRPAARWLMVGGFFSGGVGVYVFYALQPYVLRLFGNPDAYQVAGLVAAAVACAQVVGGFAAPLVHRLLPRRTTVLLVGGAGSALCLALMGAAHSFGTAMALVLTWALVGAAVAPARQTYLNRLVPAGQRATVLSFDSLVTSAGGVVTQPALGRAADVWGYGPSLVAGAVVSLASLPALAVSRRHGGGADLETSGATDDPAGAAPAAPGR